MINVLYLNEGRMFLLYQFFNITFFGNDCHLILEKLYKTALEGGSEKNVGDRLAKSPEISITVKIGRSNFLYSFGFWKDKLREFSTTRTFHPTFIANGMKHALYKEKIANSYDKTRTSWIDLQTT